MSELADLLELMAGATERFRTVRGVVRTWWHHPREVEARRRAYVAEGNAEAAAAVAHAAEAGASPPTAELRTRFWLALPDRMREERAAGAGPRTLVRAGRLWWSRDQDGVTTNEGTPDHGHGSMVDSELLAPVVLLPGLQLRVRGRRVIAGRAGIVAAAEPCTPPPVLGTWRRTPRTAWTRSSWSTRSGASCCGASAPLTPGVQPVRWWPRAG